MTQALRIVADTNVLISRLLAPESIPGRAVSHAVSRGQLLASDATLDELATVLGRSKFDRYVTAEERRQFLRLLYRIVEIPPITQRFSDCSDPTDNKFLELAVSGQSSVIVTGDKALLRLHPFHQIPILKPVGYLSQFS